LEEPELERPLNIAVLMGGMSSEREVSLNSGENVASALSARGHNVVKVVMNDEKLNGMGRLKPDIVFIALHGGFGEDGGVQALLEARGLPYTGSGVEASKLAMNKAASKEIFLANGVPTPPYFGVAKGALSDSHVVLAEKLGLPVVVKPVAEGSSVRVTIVRHGKDLGAALAEAFNFGEVALIEKYIPGRELTVGILDGRALPIIEIVPKDGYYDYQAKYKSEETQYLLEFELDPQIYKNIQAACLKAHDVLGCKVFSRVDVRYDPADTFYVLEVNTIPGFTSHSLLPKAAQAVGIEFGELCERIIVASLREQVKMDCPAYSSRPTGVAEQVARA
jgi:D-alanine-D-alanine ligase